MCEPTTIAGVAIASGSLINAYGQYQAGQAGAKIDENNAKLAKYQASTALQLGEQDASKVRAEGSQAAAAARVAAGAGGVDATVGSPADAQAVSLINSEADAARIKANAAREAWGYKQEARDLKAQAKQKRRQGILGAVGAGLSGVGSILGRSG